MGQKSFPRHTGRGEDEAGQIYAGGGGGEDSNTPLPITIPSCMYASSFIALLKMNFLHPFNKKKKKYKRGNKYNKRANK